MFRLTKRQGALVGLAILVASLLGIGFYIYHYWWSPVPNQRLEQISLQPVGKNGVVVNLSSDYDYQVTPDYVAIYRGYYHKNIDQHWSSKDFRPVDFVKIDLYRPKDKGKLYKTIDILALVQAYNKNYQPLVDSGIGGLLQNRETGEYYLHWRAYDMREMSPDWEWSGDGLTVHVLYINIETGKVIESPKEDNTPPFKKVTNINDNYIFKKEVSDVYQKPVKVRGLKNNLFTYTFSKGADLMGTDFIKRYPEATKLLNAGGRLVWYEDTKILAELLAKGGETDVFEGATLYGEYSKDGLDHKVQSYDELMEWYQEPERIAQRKAKDTEEKEE